MSITVPAIRRQARPGQAEALLALAQAHLIVAAQHRDRRIEAWVFQSRTDPHCRLWVSTWEGAEGHWTRMETAHARDSVAWFQNREREVRRLETR